MFSHEFTFSAGRLEVTDNRDTQYDVSGANDDMAILSVANNTSEILLSRLEL